MQVDAHVMLARSLHVATMNDLSVTPDERSLLLSTCNVICHDGLRF